MSEPSLYWTLLMLASNGQKQNREFPLAKERVQSLATEVELTLQKVLLEDFRAGRPQGLASRLCLRCYVSSQIVEACRELVRRFGQYYGFIERDLLPHVLDDEGKLEVSGPYQPLSLKILESFDPQRSSLNTWTTRLTQQHSGLNRFLNEQGLYMASDWSLLNGASSQSIRTILADLHWLSESEIDTACELLDAYHGVYRRDRLHKKQKGPCDPPSVSQLEEIQQLLQGRKISVSVEDVLSELLTLGNQIRQYRLVKAQGTPNQQSIDNPNVPELEDQATQSSVDPEAEQAFLCFCQQSLSDALSRSLKQVVSQRLQKLRKDKPKQYLTALKLFHCQGMAMGEIAKHVGLKAQYQVSRLLKLKELRTDVRHLTIQLLRAEVQEKLKKLVSPEELRQLDQQIEAFLSESVDELLQDDEENSRRPKDYLMQSRFSDALCHLLDQNLFDHSP